MTNQTCIRLSIRYRSPKSQEFSPALIDQLKTKGLSQQLQKEISKLGLPYCRNDAINIPWAGTVQCEWYLTTGSVSFLRYIYPFAIFSNFSVQKLVYTLMDKLRPEPGTEREKEITDWMAEFSVCVSCLLYEYEQKD